VKINDVGYNLLFTVCVFSEEEEEGQAKVGEIQEPGLFVFSLLSALLLSTMKGESYRAPEK